ncbi:MAG: LysM peptidoglycan-binding domain-containing protein [Candidatus Omnitrophica bacterium]|nr:LysM peptidoglycan-binding domain-containing protein [Candidatus Omnitrophota bacterium]
MRTREFGIAVLLVSLGAAGCARITSQVVEKPRVDQELTGNRGYLAGSAPAAAPRKSTRQVLQTNVELATLDEMTPWRKQKGSAPLASPAPESAAGVSSVPVWPEESPAASWESEPREELPVSPTRPVPSASSLSSSETPTTYTVKSGDTLDKIAAKVYGDSNEWRRIYQANKDRLSTPNRIYPGQKLTIPPARAKKRHTAPSSDLK